jgi:precorrin-3B C17-methyltransferase
MAGKIHIVGIGPGSPDWLAPAARKAIESADMIVGYQTYLQQIESLATAIPRESSAMRHEIERARRAIELSEAGKTIAIVSSGDAGIYGMAGLIFELLENRRMTTVQVEVFPGITALSAAAALLGAPLMTDFAAISLSDYLTPLDTILRRLRAAIEADFVICLYNPRSHQRNEPYERTQQLLLENLGGDHPVGVVRNAFRKNQEVIVTTLEDLCSLEIGMDSILIIGNSSTRIWNGKMVTSRGYRIDQED